MEIYRKMAVVWDTTFDAGFYYIYAGGTTVVGYSSLDYLTGGAPLGDLADTTADMYSGAVMKECYLYGENKSDGGTITFKFAGNRTGGWTHVKIGPTVFEYSDFTRTYVASPSVTTFEYSYNHNTSVDPCPFTDSLSALYQARTRLIFYNSAPTIPSKHGIECRNYRNCRTWTNEEQHLVVCASGVANVTAAANYVTVYADNVDKVSIWLLDTNNDNSPYGINVSNITSTSFRINNGSLDNQSIGYTAFRNT